jgi:hypothetical protein
MTGTGRHRSRLVRLCTIASQIGNVVLFDGSPDETISGRSWREGVLGGDPVWTRRAALIDRLFRDPNHCRKSHLLDVAFARLILAL